jgi:hypothetical protein
MTHSGSSLAAIRFQRFGSNQLPDCSKTCSCGSKPWAFPPGAPIDGSPEIASNVMVSPALASSA